MNLTIGQDVLTSALLLTVVPHSLVLTFVHVRVHPIPVLDVVLILAIVDSPVSPEELT